MLKPAPRNSLVAHAIDALRTELVKGTWPIGERIPPEASLAAMLGVSRNTIREAVRVLAHSEVLDVRQGDGTYVRRNTDPAETVRRISHAGLRDHLELRCMLEVEAASLAASRRTEEDVVRLTRLLAERGSSADGGVAAFISRDVAFHVAVADASHNQPLAELYRYFSEAIRRHMGETLADCRLPEPGEAEHHAVLDAIARGDAAAAAAAARHIVEPMSTKLTEILGG